MDDYNPESGSQRQMDVQDVLADTVHAPPNPPPETLLANFQLLGTCISLPEAPPDHQVTLA